MIDNRTMKNISESAIAKNQTPRTTDEVIKYQNFQSNAHGKISKYYFTDSNQTKNPTSLPIH
jgi:hypothetical protein